MLKKFFVNLILIILALLSLECYSFFITKNQNEIFKEQASKLKSNNTAGYYTKYRLLNKFNVKACRKSFFKNSSCKKPIILFGCSFAEGAGLDDVQTPCYKLSQLTGRSCINKTKGATGTQFMYFQLSDDEIMSDTPEAEYIIYVFIWNHLQRLYNYQVNPLIDMYNLRYKVVNGHLKNITPNFNPFYSSFLIKRLLNKIVNERTYKESCYFNLFNKIMEESVNIAKKRYPNVKFIMIEFPELSRKKLPAYEIEKLKKMGIQVVKAQELAGDNNLYDAKYWLPDNIHPTEEAWDLILPELKKQYLN